MTQPFPDLEIFKGPDASTRLEADIYDLEVDGELPVSLSGNFFRVQPDPQFPPKMANDIFFNGDGLVTSLTFADGHVDFRSRYAQTEKFLAERAARKSLYGAYRNPYTDDPSVAGKSRTTSNTHTYVHAGKLLALKEDGLPTVMNPHTLETIAANYDFGGAMTGETFTAHPKIDPVTGDMIAFGYEARGNGSDDIAYYVIGKDGVLKREVWLKSPHPAMVHDWGVTQNYVIFPIMPLVSDIERMKAGKPRWMYRNDLDRYYGVLPRNGEARDVRWFRLPNGFQAHTFNAFDDNGKVYLDMTVATDNVFSFFPDEHGNAPHPMTIQVPITRACFDMTSNSDSVTSTILASAEQIMGDFPHCDDRYSTLPYRYAFMNSIDFTQDYDYERLGPPGGMLFNGIGRLDVSAGAAEKWHTGNASVQEPVFVPRSADAPEGDGYVMAVVTRLLENRSDVVVLDSAHIADGPIATIKLPVRLRTGLHGNWVPASQMTASPATV